MNPETENYIFQRARPQIVWIPGPIRGIMQGKLLYNGEGLVEVKALLNPDCPVNGKFIFRSKPDKVMLLSAN